MDRCGVIKSRTFDSGCIFGGEGSLGFTAHLRQLVEKHHTRWVLMRRRRQIQHGQEGFGQGDFFWYLCCFISV